MRDAMKVIAGIGFLAWFALFATPVICYYTEKWWNWWLP